MRTSDRGQQHISALLDGLPFVPCETWVCVHVAGLHRCQSRASLLEVESGRNVFTDDRAASARNGAARRRRAARPRPRNDGVRLPDDERVLALPRPYLFAPDRNRRGGYNRGALILRPGAAWATPARTSRTGSQSLPRTRTCGLPRNIAAGGALHGIDRGTKLPEPVEGDPYTAERAAPSAVPRRGRRRPRPQRVLPRGVRRPARRPLRDDEVRRTPAL